MTDHQERTRAAFRLNLEQQKKQAKELLKNARTGNAQALSRIERITPQGTSTATAASLKLSDAQFVVARELGFASWSELKVHIAGMDRARGSIERKTHVPDEGTKTLHLRCGSDIKPTLLTAGFQGDFLEHSYPYCHGPVTATDDHFEREAKFIVESFGKRKNLSFEAAVARRREEERQLAISAEQYDRIVLWMEHDCFDQLVLVRCLAHYATSKRPPELEIVDINRFPGTVRFIGLGQLPVEALRLLWEGRKPVTEKALQLAANAWAALVLSDPRPLAALMRTGCLALPNLGFALHRLLQELPSVSGGTSLTERLTLQLLSEQSATINNLWALLTYQRDPLPFATDLMFLKTIECMQELSDAPIVRTAGKNEWDDTVSITETGRQLLQGKRDLLSMQPQPRWVGGVEIRAGAANWRWDEQKRDVILS